MIYRTFKTFEKEGGKDCVDRSGIPGSDRGAVRFSIKSYRVGEHKRTDP